MLEERIGEWRSYLAHRQAIHTMDVDELEDHLRSQVADLQEAGLDEEEAFLIAVKRVGALDSLSQEYAREYSERLWKKLVVDPDADDGGLGWNKEALVAVGLAVGSAVAFKLPQLFGMPLFSAESIEDMDAANSPAISNPTVPTGIALRANSRYTASAALLPSWA